MAGNTLKQRQQEVGISSGAQRGILLKVSRLKLSAADVQVDFPSQSHVLFYWTAGPGGSSQMPRGTALYISNINAH